MAFVVVLDLDLGSREPWRAVRLLHFEHDAGVAPDGDFPIQRELKAFVLLLGDDVAALSL
jgi:hypothetical protein